MPESDRWTLLGMVVPKTDMNRRWDGFQVPKTKYSNLFHSTKRRHKKRRYQNHPKSFSISSDKQLRDVEHVVPTNTCQRTPCCTVVPTHTFRQHRDVLTTACIDHVPTRDELLQRLQITWHSLHHTASSGRKSRREHHRKMMDKWWKTVWEHDWQIMELVGIMLKKKTISQF